MRHLAQDLAAAAIVGNVVIHLDAAVDGARMEDDAVRLQARRTLASESELCPIIRSDGSSSRPLKLDPEHHDRIKIADVRVKIVGYRY